MLRITFYQQSMAEIDPDFLRLPQDSFERQLRDLLPRIVSADDFRRFYSDSGTGSCCPMVLCGMLLLQARHKVSDPEVIRRSRCDLAWRYALGLAAGDLPPAVTSLRRFRAKLRKLLGDDFLHRRVLALAVKDGHVPDLVLQAVDSTNTECRGAVIDTFNLVATGIGNVLRIVARCLGGSAPELAKEWKLERYLIRSVKGAAGIDWSDEKARNALLTEEIGDAERLPGLIAALQVRLPSCVDDALNLLATVARQDVEQQEDGTYRIVRGTASGRVISVTDPEARHGRKSASKTITGFKTHVLGTIESQFVTGIVITDAATHDAAPTVKVLEQAQDAGVGPEEAVGDAAYGTGANVRACKERGVSMRTKLPTPSHKNVFPKRAFRIDLEEGTVTCPEGHLATQRAMVKATDGGPTPVARFRFDKATCQACPLKDRCCSETAKGGARSIVLSSHEAELQESIAFNRTARAQEVLRSRSAVERLISHLVRMGMRHARYFGMHMVQFQAFMTSASYNLQRVVTLSAAAAKRAA